MVIANFSQDGMHEKRSAALSSVIAAVGLTGFKLIVGLSTGSLGILAEAAHSGLDLMAAVMTFLAVRISGRPADRNHLYGHGKVENLSGLFETLLLLLTCAWIIYEATHRLMFHALDIEVNVWSLGPDGKGGALPVSHVKTPADPADADNIYSDTAKR